MRVALTKGTLRVPPTYFAVQHALAMPDIEWRVFTLCAEVHDPAVRLEIDEAVPGARVLPARAKAALKWGRERAMARRIERWAPDLIHQQQATWSLGAIEAVRRTGAPLVTTLHGFDAYPRPEGVRPSLLGPTGAWNGFNRRAAFDASNLLLAVSRHLADIAVRAGADARKLEVHYQGVDTDWWTPGEAAHRDAGMPTVLFVGALSRLKGVPDLLAAHAALADVPHHLVLVGDGPLRVEVEAVAAKKPTIAVTGRLGRSGVREWMRRSDLLILPTRTTSGRAEAAGLVTLEAQACGLPVVVNRVGGAPEMVAPACRDLLADEADPGSLGRSLRALLSLSAAERRRIGGEARDWTVANRSMNAAVAALHGFYASLVG